MRRLTLLLMLLFPTLGWAQKAGRLPIVRFKVKAGFTASLERFKGVLSLPDGAWLARTFPGHADTSRLGRWHELHLPDGDKVDAFALQMQGVKWIEAAEPFTAPEAAYQPNDPAYAQQSAYLSTIGLPAAWDSAQGDTAVVIGIIDSGTDLDHPDLAPNLAVNRHELLNGLDDDGDGYIDNRTGIDLAGADFWNMRPDPDPTCAGAGGPSHGVHVAGIAAAATENGIGGAGVGFGCRYLPVKVAADNRSTYFKAYEGMVYAADHGARVINCSFLQSDYSPFASDAVAYCRQRGCLVVAGAGNAGTVSPAYPANLPGVLSITSCEVDGSRSSFSNYGPWVSLMAPGSNVYSTEFDDAYGVRSGTSMSTPVVSGAAALVWSKHLAESADQIAARLLWTADTTVLSLAANVPLATNLGAGRLRVAEAVRYRGPGFRASQPEVTRLDGQATAGGEDSIRIRFTLTNWLASSTPQARLQLTCLNPGFALSDARIALGRVGAGAARTLSCKLALPPGVPDNLSLILRFRYTDSGYAFTESRVVLINTTTVDWAAPDFRTTTTSNGRMGYLNNFSQRGQGISYRGYSHLYEAGYLLALGGDTAYSVVRAAPGRQSNDFARSGRARLLPAGESWRAEAAFTDSGSLLRRGLRVRLRQGAGLLPADSNILFSQAVLTNTSGQTIRQAWWGLYADWDISSAGMNDRSGADTALGLTWCRPANAPGPWYGILALSGQPSAVGGLANPALGSQPNIADGWTDAEKAQLLRAGNRFAFTGSQQGDMSHLSALGPFALEEGDSVVLAQAILFGADSASMRSRAEAARLLYAQITAARPRQVSLPWSVSPNPAMDELTVRASQPLRLSLLAPDGRLVQTHLLAHGRRGIILRHLPQGIYLLKDEQGHTRRLAIVR